MIKDAIYVDEKVVLRYYQPIPKYVKVGNKEYIFECRFGMSLLFVPEEEVQPLLSYLGGCCGGKKQVIFLAPQAVYDHWLYGKGGR